VSTSIPVSAEYPNNPWKVKGIFLEPAIIKAVAVQSRATPIVRVVRTKEVKALLRCSLNTEIE
jgi:hypothetical protein